MRDIHPSRKSVPYYECKLLLLYCFYTVILRYVVDKVYSVILQCVHCNPLLGLCLPYILTKSKTILAWSYYGKLRFVSIGRLQFLTKYCLFKCFVSLHILLISMYGYLIFLTIIPLQKVPGYPGSCTFTRQRNTCPAQCMGDLTIHQFSCSSFIMHFQLGKRKWLLK